MFKRLSSLATRRVSLHNLLLRALRSRPALVAVGAVISIFALKPAWASETVSIGVLATFPNAPDRSFIKRLEGELLKRDAAREFNFQIHDTANFETLTEVEQQTICRSRYKMLVVFSELTLRALIQQGPCVPTVFSLFTQMPQPARDAFLAPHRNWLTGFDTYIELHSKRLDILRQAYPKSKRIGVLLDKFGNDRVQIRNAVVDWGKAERIEVLPIDFEASSKELICCKLDAIYVPLSGANWDNRQRIMAAIASHNIPSIVEADAFLDLGATISYQVDRRETWPRTANQVFLIAKGISPKTLPIEGVRTVRMTINVTAANKLTPPIASGIVLAADRTR